MPFGNKLNEIKYYQDTFFDKIDNPISSISLIEIRERSMEMIFEEHGSYPADYFVFSYKNERFFGRKTISSLFLQGTQKIKKCDQIKKHMIIGLLLQNQITENGVIFFYNPLNNQEKEFLFNQMKNNASIDIAFPFPVLTTYGKEFVQKSDAWNPNDALTECLNDGEQHIRNFTVKLLSTFDLEGKKIYDPACSTGEFLSSIKHVYPNTYLIGQDLNTGMIEFAKKHHADINELHVGDSIFPCTPLESVDFIFFRFLNLSVLSAEQALTYFCKIANCCKNGGILIAFGFTPVLLSSEVFSLLGLEILQKTGYSQENDSIFQYYVLKKTRPIPELSYKNFRIFNFSILQTNLLQNAKSFFPFPRIDSRLKSRPGRMSLLEDEDNKQLIRSKL